MKKALFILLAFSANFTLQAQEEYKIEDFSDEYYAKVILHNADEPFQNPATIFVYEKRTDKELIKMDSYNIDISVNSDEDIAANIMELPYGEQSILIYDDFNFDGEKDFALQDGNNSCYRGPSFQIYLVKNGKAIYNAEFTDLAQSYCGMFSYDVNTKRIYTTTKSGCCWHQFSEFAIEKGLPVLTKQVEEAFPAHFLYRKVTESTWHNGVQSSKTTRYFNTEGMKPLFAFTIKKNNKKVVLFSNEDENPRLIYVFMKPNEEIEFLYPNEGNYEDDYKFEKLEEESTLFFFNGDTEYKIYSSANKIGMKVTTKGKVYDMPGEMLNGSILEDLIKTNNFANVTK